MLAKREQDVLSRERAVEQRERAVIESEHAAQLRVAQQGGGVGPRGGNHRKHMVHPLSPFSRWVG